MPACRRRPRYSGFTPVSRIDARGLGTCRTCHRTGVGALWTTHVHENEPIVDTPEQALDCFRRTDMDALCLGRYVLVKAQS